MSLNDETTDNNDTVTSNNIDSETDSNIAVEDSASEFDNNIKDFRTTNIH